MSIIWPPGMFFFFFSLFYLLMTRFPSLGCVHRWIPYPDHPPPLFPNNRQQQQPNTCPCLCKPLLTGWIHGCQWPCHNLMMMPTNLPCHQCKTEGSPMTNDDASDPTPTPTAVSHCSQGECAGVTTLAWPFLIWPPLPHQGPHQEPPPVLSCTCQFNV